MNRLTITARSSLVAIALITSGIIAFHPPVFAQPVFAQPVFAQPVFAQPVFVQSITSVRPCAMQLAQVVGPAQLPPECIAETSGNSIQVKYLGKQNGNDLVEVKWSSGSTSPCTSIQKFDVTVKITRKLGRTDIGSRAIAATQDGDLHSTIVEIPRGALETNPTKAEVTIKPTMAALSQVQVQLSAKGNGLPQLSNVTQKTEPSPSNCNPSLKLTDMTFLPNQAGKDVVGLFWESSNPSACRFVAAFIPTLKITHQDGSVQEVTTRTSSRLRSARLELKRTTPIRSFELKLDTLLNFVNIAKSVTRTLPL